MGPKVNTKERFVTRIKPAATKPCAGVIWNIWALKTMIASVIPKEPGVILISVEKANKVEISRLFRRERSTPYARKEKKTVNRPIAALNITMRINLMISLLFSLILYHPYTISSIFLNIRFWKCGSWGDKNMKKVTPANTIKKKVEMLIFRNW